MNRNVGSSAGGKHAPCFAATASTSCRNRVPRHGSFGRSVAAIASASSRTARHLSLGLTDNKVLQTGSGGRPVERSHAQSCARKIKWGALRPICVPKATPSRRTGGSSPEISYGCVRATVGCSVPTDTPSAPQAALGPAFQNWIQSASISSCSQRNSLRGPRRPVL